MTRQANLPPELAAIAPEWPCNHVPYWQVGFGTAKAWLAHCSLQAPSRRSALARARREVAMLWRILGLHAGGEAPPIPEAALAPISGHPIRDDLGQCASALSEDLLKAAGYGSLLDLRDHPWDAAEAKGAVRAALRRVAAIPGALGMGRGILIRHSGAGYDVNDRPMAHARSEVEVHLDDGRLTGLPLPHAMRTALAACALAAVATNPEMNETEDGGEWHVDEITIPRSASARAILRGELAASAAADARMVAGFMRGLGLEAEADAFLRCQGMPA